MINRSGSHSGATPSTPEVVFTAPVAGVYLATFRAALTATLVSPPASFVVAVGGLVAASAAGYAPYAGVLTESFTYYITPLEAGQECSFQVYGTGTYEVSLSVHLVGGPDLAQE